MPNRIIKESICTSDTIDRLTWFEEVFWNRLVVNCDDFGRFDARISILKSRLFPLKGSITDKSMQGALNKLSTVGLVFLYSYEDRPYLQLVTWSKHQQVRSRKSKYPPFDVPCDQMIADDSKCSRNPIQSNPEAKARARAKSDARAKPSAGAKIGPRPKKKAASTDSGTPEPAPVIALALNDKSDYPISQKQIDKWSERYPGVEILPELRKMAGWLDANPAKRKTKSGILRFVTTWLSAEQDKGGGLCGHHPPAAGKSAAGGEEGLPRLGNYV